MKSSEIYAKSKKQATQYKLWGASVSIKQPNYVGRIEVTVTAPNAQQARVLMKAQYGVQDWQVGSVREIK